MKKFWLLCLCSFCCTTIYVHAGTPITHPSQTICEGSSATLTATTLGDSYLWTPNGETTQSITVQPTNNSNYLCTVTKNGSSINTGNLITAGGFEFPPTSPITSAQNQLGDYINYQYLNFDQSGVNINIGATTTAQNANNVKTLYFSNLAPHSGNYLFVCDGSNSSDARVWQARNLKLQGGVEYQFSCFAANIDKEYSIHGASSLAKLKFLIENEDGTTDLLQFTVPTTLGLWQEYKATYTPSKNMSWCHIYIVNYTTVNAGNDFAIDDIYFGTTITSGDDKTDESFTVNVDKKPTVSVNDQNVCTNQNVTLSALIQGAYTSISWLENSTAMTDNTTSITAKAPGVIGQSNLYDILVTNGTCSPVNASASVKALDCSVETTITHNINVCQNDTLPITITPSTLTGTFLWDTGETTESIQVSIMDPTSSHTCVVTDNAQITREIFNITTEDCHVENSSTFCISDCIKLSIIREYDDPSNITYIWNTDPTHNDSTLIVCPTEINSTYTCQVVHHDNYDSREMVTFNITLEDCSETESLTHDTLFCEGTDVVLSSLYPQLADSYNWSDGSTESSITVSPQNETTYTCVTFIDTNYGYTLYETFNVQPVSNPIINNIETTSTQANIQIVNGTAPFDYIVDDKHHTNPTIDNQSIGVHNVHIVDANGCSTIGNFEIVSHEIQPMVFFTPNGDNLNDRWEVKGIEFYPDAVIQIFDRFNKQLAKYNGSDPGWDGIYKGHGMPTTDYWYLITIKKLSKQYSGHFILKR
ncbi:MAG: T9SS type B sorting domain-containing protein [Bacteroidia bacterium]|nr:T9SS type B sorting domain-containing protein [Bacteroidia bacterium]